MSEPKFEAIDVPGEIIMLEGAKPELTYHLVCLQNNGINIFDPRFDESSICRAEPSEYGLTTDQRDKMVALNEALIREQNILFDMVSDRIDQSAKAIQDNLGVKEGDLAAHYLNNDVIENGFSKLSKGLADYAAAELENFCAEPAPKAAAPKGPRLGM